MHSRQIRRVNLSLHLSPEHSRADLRAMQQLKQWHDALLQAGSDVNDVNMQIRRFHRSVYLAGLQLYLMSPPLCSHVAESLGREALTPDALWAEMQRDGLLPDAGERPVPAGFNEPQLAQMRELMAQAVPVDRNETLEALREELAALKAMLAPQAQSAIAQREAAADDGGATIIDPDAVPVAKMNKIRQKGIF
ncbi:hypothetical protein ACRS85_17490 [Pluralibacter gergoviae]|uniref:hypothetical protein n=1 Tax=Pluralibacter gergoviae TaxID=61647 RepID=UPI003EE2ABDF